MAFGLMFLDGTGVNHGSGLRCMTVVDMGPDTRSREHQAEVQRDAYFAQQKGFSWSQQTGYNFRFRARNVNQNSRNQCRRALKGALSASGP